MTALGAALAGSSGLPLKSLPAILALARKHHPGQTTHVLYHADCKDGFGAALSAWKVLGDQATYIPVKYGEPVPSLPKDARVAIVDFSYPRKQLLELKDNVDDVVVLDHHETAQHNLKGLDFAVFDMHRAGSGLSWHYFHPKEPLPDLVGHLEDYDLWRFKMPGTMDVNMALESYPKDFKLWDKLSHDVGGLKSEGATVNRFIDREVERITDSTARYGSIAGYRVPVANASSDVDQLCHHLLQKFPKAPFVGVYYDRADGGRKWSLRSRGKVDVAAVAEKFGGGGHANASGFQEPADRPIRVEPAGGHGEAVTES